MTAYGKGSCLQEGTVKIWLIDNVGTKRIFILDNCLYHPDYPVIVSLRDVMQRNSLMQTGVKKLASSLDTQLTFLLGLLDK